MVPDVFRKIEGHLRRVLGGEAKHDLQIQVPGTSYNFSPQNLVVSCQPARNESGAIVGISVAISDVTDQKHAEQGLR
jgi:signal transduction histidine kinase